MKKSAVLFLIVLISFSCQNKPTNQEEHVVIEPAKKTQIDEKISNQAIDKSENGKKWLIEAIQTYFKKDFPKMSGITTKTYEEYKTDATNVGLDTDVAMTQAEFEKKWKDRYNTKFAGTGTGFLISGQDWGEIEVTQCNLLLQDENSYVFQTTISDTELKTDYKRDIKIIASGDAFLIDDVKEYD